MAKYLTKQRRTLLDFLESNRDSAFSAHQIAQELSDFDISLSAVYRNLSELETEGKIRRITSNGTRDVFYQYTAAPECQNKLHLSCSKCGRTFHLSDDGTDQLLSLIKSTNDFMLSKEDTVLFGTCITCRLKKRGFNQ